MQSEHKNLFYIKMKQQFFRDFPPVILALFRFFFFANPSNKSSRLLLYTFRRVIFFAIRVQIKRIFFQDITDIITEKHTSVGWPWQKKYKRFSAFVISPTVPFFFTFSGIFYYQCIMLYKGEDIIFENLSNFRVYKNVLFRNLVSSIFLFILFFQEGQTVIVLN